MHSPPKTFPSLPAVRKIFIVLIVLLAVGGLTPLNAQYYILRSVEGKKVRVHLEALRHELRVSCLHDTLLLYSSFGDYHARKLDSSFLQITYAVRGGSGYNPENTAILAVRDGRLCQALLLLSSFETMAEKYYHTLHTGLKLTADQKDNFVLTLRAREYLKDETHPSGWHKKWAPVSLRWNKQLTAFYGKAVVADSTFTAMEWNQNIEYMQFNAGDTLPMINLAGNPYYFAEGSWYSPVDERLDSQEDTVIDKLLNLSDVRRKSAWIDSVTHHRHGISLMELETANWPSDTGRYVVQAGYHSRQGFDPHYLFTVYQPDLAIKTVIQTNPTRSP